MKLPILPHPASLAAALARHREGFPILPVSVVALPTTPSIVSASQPADTGSTPSLPASGRASTNAPLGMEQNL